MPQLSDAGDGVLVLDLGDGENRLGPVAVGQLAELLDDVGGRDGPRALVTAARGKHWSTGLDLDWVAAQPGGVEDYVASVQELFARTLTLPVPTVAALQGHTFAAGAMWALAHDVRVMRADRGFFCLPEVDLGIPFTPGMSALVQARLTPQVAHEAMTTARRYGGTDAAAAGLVDVAVPEADVLPVALERARALAAKAGPTLATIRSRMYGPVLEALLRRGDFTVG